MSEEKCKKILLSLLTLRMGLENAQEKKKAVVSLTKEEKEKGDSRGCIIPGLRNVIRADCSLREIFFPGLARISYKKGQNTLQISVLLPY